MFPTILDVRTRLPTTHPCPEGTGESELACLTSLRRVKCIRNARRGQFFIEEESESLRVPLLLSVPIRIKSALGWLALRANGGCLD